MNGNQIQAQNSGQKRTKCADALLVSNFPKTEHAHALVVLQFVCFFSPIKSFSSTPLIIPK